MSEPERIRVAPLTKWARERIRKHGDTFVVRRKSGSRVLVESLGRTDQGRTTWLAWFDIGFDVVECK